MAVASASSYPPSVAVLARVLLVLLVAARVLLVAAPAAAAPGAGSEASEASEANKAIAAGRRALRSGQLAEAAGLLAVAAAAFPDRLDVQRDRGLALLLLRRYGEACRLLRRVGERAPGDAAAQGLRRLCARVDPRAAALTLFAEVGLQYDSNAVLDSTMPAPGWGGLRSVARLGLSGSWGRGPLRLAGGADYYQSVHLDQRDALGLLDVSAPAAQLAVTWQGDRLQATLGSRWRETFIDLYHLHYARELDGVFALALRDGRRWQLAAELAVRLWRFFDGNPEGGLDDRDTLSLEPTVELRLQPARWLPLVVARATYLRREADGDDFDHHGARLELWGRFAPFPRWPLQLWLTASYTARRFVHHHEGRQDHELSALAEARLGLGSGLSLALGYQHTSNLSTHARSRYHREVASLSLQVRR